MLDEKDLQAIQKMVDAAEQRIVKNTAILMDEKLTAQKDQILDEATHRMQVLLDTQVTTQFNLLAEGQQTILETLAPKNKVEELEDEMVFMKQVIKAMSQEIAELKKAQ